MPQREQDFSDGCPTTYVALSSLTCTSPMYAQRWNTQGPLWHGPIRDEDAFFFFFFFLLNPKED